TSGSLGKAATTARPAVRAFRFASVIIFSTRPWISLSLASVGRTRSVRRIETVRFLNRARRGPCLRLSLRPPMQWAMSALVLVVAFVLEGGGIEAVRLGLGDDEPAHPEPFLHLVERLLAEVAHPEKV